MLRKRVGCNRYIFTYLHVHTYNYMCVFFNLYKAYRIHRMYMSMHVAYTCMYIYTSMYTRVYQNLATSSENCRTFPKVGPHYKEKVCKFLARSDYFLGPNSCVLFEIIVARRKIRTAQ